MWATVGIFQISNGIFTNLEVDQQRSLANRQDSCTYDGYIFYSDKDLNYHGALSRSLGQTNLMNLLKQPRVPQVRYETRTSASTPTNVHTVEQCRSNANGEDPLCFSDQEPALAHSDLLNADQDDFSAHQTNGSASSAMNLAKRSQERRGHQDPKRNDSRKPSKAGFQGQVNSQDCDIMELHQVMVAVNHIKTGLGGLANFTATPNAPTGLASSKLECLLAKGKSSGLSSWFYFYTAGALIKISPTMINKGTLRRADIKMETERSRSNIRRWKFAVDMTSSIINQLYNKDGWGARAFLIYHALAGE